MSPRLDAARRTGMPTEELSMTLRAKEHPPPRRRRSDRNDIVFNNDDYLRTQFKQLFKAHPS